MTFTIRTFVVVEWNSRWTLQDEEVNAFLANAARKGLTIREIL